jgi:signal transduction histidine kinase
MPITLKTAAALLTIFLALFASAWVILERAVQPRFEQLEVSSHDLDRARIEANLSALANDLGARALDYAHWNDTYAYVTGRNPSFIADNFTTQWFVDYGVDILIFADDSGAVLWTRSRAADGAMAPDPMLAREMLLHASATPSSTAPVTGTMWTAAGPVLFAAVQSSPNDSAGAPHGYVIMGAHLSREALEERVQADVQFIDKNAADPSLVEQMDALNAASFTTWVTPDKMHSLIALHEADGALAGAVLAERPRDIAILGANTVRLALGLFAVMSVLAAITLWLLLRHLVIARIVRLERSLHAQSSEPEFLPDDETGEHDEIGRLTDAYNALVLRSRDFAARAQTAKTENEAAATASRMKADFLTNIGYELRTPVDAVIGYAELVEEELADSGYTSGNADLARIRAAARDLLTMVNEILDLSKLEAGRLEITPEEFRVDEMLRGVLATITPLAKARTNTVRLDLDPGLGTIYSDQNRLRQCLLNVLTIACKYTQGGTLTLKAARQRAPEGEVVRFAICHVGADLSEAQLSRLFEPFTEADSSIARKAGGAGLGLAITGRLMQLMGGSIETAQSQEEGSAFVLIAPASYDERRACKGPLARDSLAA